MKRLPIHSFLCLSGLLTCFFFLTACKGDDDSALSSTGISGISGNVSTGAHDYYVKGTTLFLTAGGITDPAPEQTSYQWNIKDTDTKAVWGQAIKYRCPEDAASFTLTLTASAIGYYNTSVSKNVVLIDDNYVETVEGISAGSTFTDARDGQTYQYARIGAYDWMVQNLNWDGAGKVYKNESEYAIIFGRLYSWEEATSATHPVCPAGWQLPSNAEWEDLGAALNNGTAVDFESHWPELGTRAAVNATVSGKTLWPYDPANTKTNTLGWNALPAGKATAGNTSSDNGRYGYWWSATPYNAESAYYRYIVYNNASFYFNYGNQNALYFSVRCVR
jgi:uncharacterized protein (TIGR02145 family)